jgi:hypothetical protein
MINAMENHFMQAPYCNRMSSSVDNTYIHTQWIYKNIKNQNLNLNTIEYSLPVFVYGLA